MKIWPPTTCVLALLFSLLSSCNVSTPEDPVLPEPTPAMAYVPGSSAWDCSSAGDPYTFSIQYLTPQQSGGSIIPNGMSYYVYLPSTQPYGLGQNCVCRIQYFDLEFDYLPPSTQIMVGNLQGYSIPFEGPLNLANGRREIRIDKRYIAQGILIGFDPGVSPRPILKYSGGFCIVDNISAPRLDVEEIYTFAYAEPLLHPETQEEYLAFYLPLFDLVPYIP